MNGINSHFFNQQFGLKIMSLLAAITLWILVFGSRTIEISKEIPFEVALAEDQILVDPVPEKVVFRISGPKAFLRSVTNRLEDPIRATIKGIKNGVVTHRVLAEHIKLPPGVKVQSIVPNVIQIRIEELKHKSVPIRLETIGSLPAGLKSTRINILPLQLKIRGSKNRVVALNALPTLPVDLSAIHETTILPLAFDFSSYGIEPDAPLPELLVEVQGKGAAFRIRNVPLKIKSNRNAVSPDERITVIVRTEPGDPLKVIGESVTAEVDVSDYADGDYYKWIKVALPNRVHLVRVIPSMTRINIKGQ
jgi:YbbR domain-containing protein